MFHFQHRFPHRFSYLRNLRRRFALKLFLTFPLFINFGTKSHTQIDPWELKKAQNYCAYSKKLNFFLFYLKYEKRQSKKCLERQFLGKFFVLDRSKIKIC